MLLTVVDLDHLDGLVGTGGCVCWADGWKEAEWR